MCEDKKENNNRFVVHLAVFSLKLKLLKTTLLGIFNFFKFGKREKLNSFIFFPCYILPQTQSKTL